MICRFCSAEIDPNAQFCVSCGNRLTSQDKLMDDFDATVLAPVPLGETKADGIAPLLPNEPHNKKNRSGKALFIILPIVLVAVIALVVFGVYRSKNKEEEATAAQAASTVTSKVATVTVPEVTEPPEKPQEDWKIQYEKILQKMIDDGYKFNASWVNDVDGDGVPMVALSTTDAACKIPNVIINYENGKVTVKDDIVNSGTGWSIIDEVWFCEGTDYIVYRYYGNTDGTYPSNHQSIYGISELGSYSLFAEEEVFLPGEYEREIEAVRAEGGKVDFKKYQNYIVDELNKSAYRFLGDDAILINYSFVMADFSKFESETAPDAVIQAAVDYLNVQLGIRLDVKNNAVDTSKEAVAQAYKKVLSGCEEGTRYGLCDIDGNGIKELIVEKGIYKYDLRWYIYTYDTLNGNATVYLGSFEATYYTLHTPKGQNGLYMYKVVKETEELKMISISDNAAKESVVVEMRPYSQDTALDPGRELEMTDYNDHSLLNNI